MLDMIRHVLEFVTSQLNHGVEQTPVKMTR